MKFCRAGPRGPPSLWHVSETYKTPEKNETSRGQAGKQFITSEDIASLLKCAKKQVTPGRRRAQKSEILTSTPVNNELRQKYPEKLTRENTKKEGNLSLTRKNSRIKKREIKKGIKAKKKLILQDEPVLRKKKSAKANGKSSQKEKYVCLICSSSVSSFKQIWVQ